MIPNDDMDDTDTNSASVWMFRVLVFYIVQQMKVEQKMTGLELAKFSLLRILEGYGPKSMSALGKLLYQSKPYMSHLVDSLIKEDLVERIPDQNDRRVINIGMTGKGVTYLNNKKQFAINDMKSLIENQPPEYITELCQTAKKYYELLTQIEQSELMDSIILKTEDNFST